MPLPSAPPFLCTRERGARRGTQGNVAIITAIVIVMLFGFAALAVVVGNLYRVRTQARAALDAAALAGASGLNGKLAGLDEARTRAIQYGARHRVYTSQLQLTAEEIELGQWDFSSSTFILPAPSLDQTNAVRVTHTTEPIIHPFAAILGNRASPVSALAVAVGGGPMNAPCAFPMMVSDCAVVESSGLNCGYCMQMQDSNTDTAGWTAYSGRAVNANTIFDAIAAACTTGGADPQPQVNADGTCAAECANQARLPEELPVNNGNLMNTGPNNFCPLIQLILMRNGAPEPFKVTVPVMKTGLTAPCNPAYRGVVPLAGFAELRVFGAKCGNSDPGVVADHETSSCAPSSGKFVLAELDCHERIDAPGGGGFFGLQARPRLVQ